MKEKIPLIALVLSIISIIFLLKNNNDLKELYCANVESVFAERRFIQESLKDVENELSISIDWDRKAYFIDGKEVLNPITTESRYKCE